MKGVVERLLPQAGQIGVYLNGYDHVPGFLRRRRIVIARSQDRGDIRDNGKFFFLSQSEARYYAAVDDDLLYPHDYLPHLVRYLGDAEQLAAVGVHGAIYPSPVVDLFDPRFLLHFQDPLAHVMPVHLLGTGTTMIDQSDWNLELSEFGTPGMADVWFAAAAVKRNAGLFVVPRVRNWLSSVERQAIESSPEALFYEGLLERSQQVSVLREAAPSADALEGLVRPLITSANFSENFSLHQTIDLDRVRTQLGYAPLSASAAAEAAALLESHRTTWSDDHLLTSDDSRNLVQLTADLLSDRVSADDVGPVLALLDRLRDLAVTDPRKWVTLPPAVRYDSSLDRVEELKTRLLERGMRRSPIDARRLWSIFDDTEMISLSPALRAERVSIRTPFQRLPAFTNLAQENPTAAASRLYEYFEATDWKREPDLAALKKAFGSAFDSDDVQILLCLAAAGSGNQPLAHRALERLRQRSPFDVDIRLLAAGISVADTDTPGDALLPVLQVLDEALETRDMSLYRELMHTAGDREHWIYHLKSEAESGVDAGSMPTVSVLMTTHNDAETIAQAMLSILGSSGVDVQLVVVDDASTDDTLQQVRGIDDPRVKVVQNEMNLGPYVSRNRGLEHARGQYIAIADADDWSHPQRLEYQTSILESTPHVFACKVAHIRVKPNGVVDLENHLRFVGDGPMSLMFRRWLIDHIGGFDHVRTRGDIEFQRRITARFGNDALASFGTPLVLATSSRTSNSKRFSDESLNLYRAAARRWHLQRARTDALYVPLSGSRAPFMAPYDLLVEHVSTEDSARRSSPSGVSQ